VLNIHHGTITDVILLLDGLQVTTSWLRGTLLLLLLLLLLPVLPFAAAAAAAAATGVTASGSCSRLQGLVSG
jgi:hypothetical protein